MSEPSENMDDILAFKHEFRREFDTILDDLELDAHYGVPNELRMLGYFAGIQETSRRLTGMDDWQGIAQAREESTAFLRRAFGQYNGIIPTEHYDWAFAVPVRTNRQETMDNSSELTPFLPILDSKFGVPVDVRQRAIISLPPALLDVYEGDESKKGAVVFTPLFEDMKTDLAGRSIGENVKLRRDIMQQTSDFVHRRLGASVMGLGALLPALTNFGKDIHEEGLVTTTGHGGTVYLLGETARQELERGVQPNIGVIGAAGSIGRASADYILQELPGAVLYVHDTNEAALHRRVDDDSDWAKRAHVMGSIVETLNSSDTVVVAITERIDLDILDPEKQLDLRDKVIIDDSQPGSFDRAQVEARGGRLRWVVGQDTSEGQALHRVGGYNYGETVGLYGKGAVWGCEAEVGAIALLGFDYQAINHRVTAVDARDTGESLRRIGITTAPAQSYGQLVA